MIPVPTASSGAQPYRDSLEQIRTAWQNEEYETAIDWSRTYVLRDSTSAEAYLLLGRSHQKLRQYQNAVKAFEEALHHGKQSPRLLTALGESYRHLGYLNRAERAQRRALKLDPSNRRLVQLRLARIQEDQRDWGRAAHLYRSLLATDSTNTMLRVRLAQAEAKRGRRPSAIAHYKRVHRDHPQNGAVALSLSRLFVETNQLAKALRTTDRSLPSNPRWPPLWRRHANVAFKLDSLTIAEQAYERTLQLGDSSTTVLQRLGIARLGQKKHREALSPLRRAYRRDTTRARTCFYLATAHRGIDSLHAALTYYDRAIDRASEGILVDALTQKASTHDRLQQLPDALQEYRTILRLQPDRNEVYFHLAALYDTYYRDKTVAARYYGLFLERSTTAQSPFHAYAERRLEALRPTLHFQKAKPPP